MSIFDTVSHGQTQMGLRMVIGGVEGVGKTTLACNAPRPLLVPLEAGFAGMTVSKTALLTHYSHVEEFFIEAKAKIALGQFPYQTLIFDTGTALERLMHTAVLERDTNYNAANSKAVTMESALGGFGRAYSFANELFEKFLKECDNLAIYHGINIIITCHIFPARIIDPAAGEYDCWDLQLHAPKNQKTYGKREIITQWADLIGILREPMMISKEKGETVRMGISKKTGRVLEVCRTPQWVAKNRFNMTNSIDIPSENAWNYVAQAIYEASKRDFYNRDVKAS